MNNSSFKFCLRREQWRTSERVQYLSAVPVCAVCHVSSRAPTTWQQSHTWACDITVMEQVFRSFTQVKVTESVNSL